MRQFYRLLKPYTRDITLAFFAIIIANGLTLLFPWGLKLIIDDAASGANIELLNTVTLILIGAALLKFYFGYVREYILIKVGEKCISDIRNSLYIHLKQLSVSYVDSTPHGEIISRIIGDTDRIRNFLFGGVVDFVYSFINIFFIVTILSFLDVQLMFISLIIVPPLLLVFLKLTPRLRRSHDDLRNYYADLTGMVGESCQGMWIISGFGRQEAAIRKFEEKQSGVFTLSCITHKLAILLWMNAEFLSSLGLIAIMWFGTQAVISGKITIGTLMAVYSYSGMIFYPVIKMVHINNDYQEAQASLSRINQFQSIRPNIKQPLFAKKKSTFEGKIEFRDVCFSYFPDKPVLQHIDLTISPHQAIALIGPSGAGKTTLINLILRFWDPQAGRIDIDGIDLKKLDINNYRHHIAMVLQDDYLFNTTIRENITYATPDATFDEICRAAKAARADEFIEKFPKKYDTIIGEKGITLSYGQRQRISIARAILRNPAILILDEATSNIDSEAERHILQESYRMLIKGRTTILIAHRLSTIKDVERIVILEQGQIIETGTHNELLMRRSRYWQMWRSQYSPLEVQK